MNQEGATCATLSWIWTASHFQPKVFASWIHLLASISLRESTKRKAVGHIRIDIKTLASGLSALLAAKSVEVKPS